MSNSLNNVYDKLSNIKNKIDNSTDTNNIDNIIANKNQDDHDVKFLDPDGNLLYTYKISELTELPELPEYLGNKCSNWNYYLSEIHNMNGDVTVCAVSDIIEVVSNDASNDNISDAVIIDDNIIA